MSYRNAATVRVSALLLVGLFCVAPARGDLVWDPGASTYDGKSFVKLQTGVGSTSLGLPGAGNPVALLMAALIRSRGTCPVASRSTEPAPSMTTTCGMCPPQ